MIELLLEFIFDLVLEGSFEVIGIKKVPVMIRVIISVVLVGFYLVVCGALIIAGIKYSAPIVSVVGGVILVGVAAVFIKEWRRMRKGGRG